jgi:hypothetical protein
VNKISASLILSVALWVPFGPASSFAQTPAEVRQAFADLHDDKVPHNCEHASEWLFTNREKLKDDLLDEFYKTDWQGRESIFSILVNTESFAPDERFIRFEAASLGDRENSGEDWEFISKHFKEFDPLLKEQLGKTTHRAHEMYVRWATAWVAKKLGVFEQYAPLYTPEVLREVAQNLKSDDKGFNASQAVRLFLLLGDQSLPTLREAAKSSDKQAASLARATIDALGGSRKGFGFLASKTLLEMTAYGDRVQSPDWLGAALEPYLDVDTYP